MRRLSIVLAIVTIVSMTLAGCAGPTQSPTPTTTTPAATTPSATTPKPTPTPTPTPTASASATPIKGGTMTIVEGAAPSAPIGIEFEGNANTYVTQQFVLERLLIEKLDGSMGPGMATTWEVNNDPANASITFHLRQGVKFHDGTEMNAEAIKWNLDAYADPGKIVPGDTAQFTSTTSYWKSYDVLDPYTIRVNYKEWRNTFLRSWENYFMVSPANFTKNGIAFARDNMVGTGPFKQTGYQKDTSLTAVRFDGYYEAGKPYLDGLKINYIADELTRTASLKAGEAQELNAGPKLASLQFKGDPNFTIINRNAGPFVLSPDSLNADSPFANLKVRQALDYAINREAIAKTFTYGYGSAAYQITSSSTLAYDPALPGRKYDPAQATQLLKDAGYPTGFKTRIIASPAGLDRDVILAIQADLKKVGIDAELVFPIPTEFQALDTSVVAPSSALIYQQIPEWSNYNTTLNVFFADPGTFYLKSLKKPDGWPDLYAKSLHTAAPDATILKQVGDAFYNDAMVAPLFYQPSVYVVSPKLHNHGLLTRGTANSWTIADTWLSK